LSGFVTFVTFVTDVSHQDAPNRPRWSGAQVPVPVCFTAATEKVFKNGRQIPGKEISVVASAWSESHQLVTLVKNVPLSTSESVQLCDP